VVLEEALLSLEAEKHGEASIRPESIGIGLIDYQTMTLKVISGIDRDRCRTAHNLGM
jgi:hypothetical protein